MKNNCTHWIYLCQRIQPIIMKGYIYRPWVGARYETGFAGRKVLVLGESFYSDGSSVPSGDVTVDIISDLLDEESEFEHYKNTFTKFAKAVTGLEQLSSADKRRFWDSVAFYEYVQVPLTAARTPPSKEDFSKSEGAFFDVLEELRPDICIAWGKRLYNNLPKGGLQGPDFKAPDGKWIESWTYFLSGGKGVLIFPIAHPSSAFSPEYWNEVLSLVI